MGFTRYLRTPSLSQDQLDALQKILKKRSSLLKKCKWALTDKEKVMDLKTELSKNNHSLGVLCPDGAYETLKLNALVDYFWSHANPTGMVLTKSIANEMSNRGDPGSSSLYDALADLAPLKGSAERMSGPLSDAQRSKLLNLQSNNFRLQDPIEMSTMAVWSRETKDSTVEEAVFVEFKSYCNDDGTRRQNVQDDALKLGKLLRDPKTPERLRTRTCYGLYKDSNRACIAFVYKLPGSLGSGTFQTQESEKLYLRQPRSLERAIRFCEVRPLGERFSLAKKLLESVMLIHATGWVHKNIRPASIVFFAKQSEPLSRSRFDWEVLDLMGWGFSRSGNLAIQVDRGGEYVGQTACPKRITLDIYQHPDKRRDPYRRYQHAYDIYSLGLVLLEIGLWSTLPELISSAVRAYPSLSTSFAKDQVAVHEYIVRWVQPLLIGRCGTIYASVVKAMLDTKSADLNTGKQQQAESCLKLAKELSRCVA